MLALANKNNKRHLQTNIEIFFVGSTIQYTDSLTKVSFKLFLVLDNESVVWYNFTRGLQDLQLMPNNFAGLNLLPSPFPLWQIFEKKLLEKL